MSTPVSKLFDLTGQTALVTGGSRGLGLQIAEALGEAGAKLMLCSRKAADLEQAAAALHAKGIDAQWIAADASDAVQIQQVVDQTMNKLGRIDILVNNAGALWWRPLVDTPAKRFDLVMGVNARAAFLCCRAVIPSMKERRWGHIINMSPPMDLALVPGRIAAGFGLIVLTALVMLVAQAPADLYFAQSLQGWEQGRFIRFHGGAQWVGWLWPYAALTYLLTRLAARGPRGTGF